MSLEQIEIEVKTASRWFRGFIDFISRTKLRVTISSVLIVVMIFLIPRLTVWVLAKDLYEKNMPQIELANSVFKKGQYRYLIDLLDACIDSDASDENKTYYCSVAEDFYEFSVDEKFVMDPNITLKRKAYLVMKSDAKFLINELDYKLLAIERPEELFSEIEFFFSWWAELLACIFALFSGFLVYGLAMQAYEARKT